MKEREQNELTSQPNSSNLEVRGDIFMPDGTNNGSPEQLQPEESRQEEVRPEEQIKSEIQVARDELASLQPLSENANADERSSYRLVRNELMKRAGIRLGSANWVNKDNDQPVTVTGYFGRGADGREYVSTEEFSGGTPLDEIEFLQSEREKQAEKIIETAEDFYEALNNLIETADHETAKEAIDVGGEGLVSFLIEGLPRDLVERHLDEFKQLKDVNAGEANERFRDIVRNIEKERGAAGLEDPLTQATSKEQAGLTGEQINETERMQAKSSPEEHEESEGPQIEIKSIPENEKTGQDIINELGGYIQNLNKNPGFIRNLTHNADIGQLIVDAYGFDELDAKRREWNEIVEGFDLSSDAKIQQTQEKLGRFFGNAVSTINKKNNKDNNREGLSHRITSVQELSKWIIQNQDRELWGENGIYPLLNEKGEFSQANFMIWLREESVKHHKNNPNSEMTPLSSVGISTDYRDISVYAMSLLREQYMKDVNKDGRVLKELAGQLIYEGFMFGELRNMSLSYIQNMGDDKKIADVLQQIHAKNTLTRPGNLEMLMTMPEDFDEDKSKRDTRVGDAFRIATDIYYNISDAEELENILGDKPITQEDFKNVFRVLEGLTDWDEDIKDFGELKYLKDDSSGFSYFDIEKGETRFLFKDGIIDMNVFAKVMNFYDVPGEESTKMDFIREFVRLKAAQKSGLKRTGMSFSAEEKTKQKVKFEEKVKSLVKSGVSEETARAKLTQRFMLERQAHRANMEYAETMAFSMQRPYGSASKQDLDRKGYDAMTKMNVQEYLLKQAGTNRGGAVGIPEQMGLFRDLSPDPITGIKTESGKTIYEIMKDLRNVENEEIKKELLDKLKFKEYAERNYAVNQQSRAVQVFHTLSDANELDLEKIVSWSYLEGVKYHVGEFQKQINEGVIKPFRYAFINSNLNFAQQVRIYDHKESEELKAPVYRTGSLAEKTLGTELYDKLHKDFDEQTDDKGNLLKNKKENKDKNGNPDFDKFLEGYDARVRIAKNSSLGVFAAQLSSHRKLASLGQAWGYHRTETFIDALKTIQDYEPDPNHEGRYRPARDKNGEIKRYYSNKDIEWLRKNSGAEVWRMLMMDSLKEGGPGLAGGLWESLTKFFESLINSELKAT